MVFASSDCRDERLDRFIPRRRIPKVRILILCHRFPFPPDHGGKIRAFEMIKHLGAHHSVTVATLAHTEKQLQQGTKLRDYCEQLIVEVVPSEVRWGRALLALATKKPSSACYFWSPRLNRSIHEASLAAPFDRVLVHCAFMARYVTNFRCEYKVLDYVDIDSGKWSDYQKYKSKPLSLGYALEANKLRRYEKEMALHFTHCSVTTSNELSEFNTLGVSVPCTVIPNGVDLTYFNPKGRIESGTPVIVFVGRMDYFPNVDAVLQFARNIFPRVRARVPKAELRIVGSDPTRSVLRLNSMPGIKVTGYVRDIRPHVADSAVAIAPLRIARGTQNKVLEMMASGIPVVASPQAAKGIQAVPGEHLIVADSAEEFAHHVVELLQDRHLRRKYSEAGRMQVERAHSWAAAMELLDDVLHLSEPPLPDHWGQLGGVPSGRHQPLTRWTVHSA
jgi:sugar transferase (PEP-CTERM/EpsH1 system associated)